MRDVIKPTIVLFVICLVVSACLALTHAVTKDKIEERARLDAENARKEVLTAAERFEKVDGLEQLIKEKPELSPVQETYKGVKGDTLAGYVFAVTTKGYGGSIQITVGIDGSGKVTGVKIGQHSETPGLGTKASESPFRSQLENITPGEELKVVKGKKTKPEEIEAISGATITSKAVVKAVQAAVDMAEALKKEGGQP